MAYDPTAWVNVSIPDFGNAPFFQDSGYLRDADWRPNTACDEGLIVGDDNGEQWTPAYGTIIRFYDSDDPACSPLP